MINIKEEEYNKYVYHFTSRETAIEHILPKKQIRLNSFKNMNDPKESKDWWLGLLLDAGGDENGKFHHGFDLFTSGARQIKENCKVLCTSRDVYTDETENFLGYSRGYARPRMWAQYGGNHTGVCLVFDRALLTKKIHQRSIDKGLQFFYGDVVYMNSQFPYEALNLLTSNFFHNGVMCKSKLFGYIEEKVLAHYQSYFFHKHEDWQSETEARWVLRGVDADPEDVNIEDSLKGVILGVDFNMTYLPLVTKPTDELDIFLGKMDWRNGRTNIFPVQ